MESEAWTVLGAVDNERIVTYVRFRRPLARGARSEERRLSSQAGWNSQGLDMNFLTYYSIRYFVGSFTPFGSFSRSIPNRHIHLSLSLLLIPLSLIIGLSLSSRLGLLTSSILLPSRLWFIIVLLGCRFRFSSRFRFIICLGLASRLWFVLIFLGRFGFIVCFLRSGFIVLLSRLWFIFSLLGGRRGFGFIVIVLGTSLGSG